MNLSCRSTGRPALTPHAIDTGAVIITGYAARKENAEAIVELFSRWAGKFVCATAGPKLEAMLAAHGSGAVAVSRETGKAVMNVDIGGGTSKVVIIKDGLVADIASIFVGSRVVAMDREGRVTRIEEAACLAAGELGLDLACGACLAAGDKQAIADLLARSLVELIEREELSPFTRRLMETAPLTCREPIDILMFSGGVAEYIYGHEILDYGDLGPCLGDKIKERLAATPLGGIVREPAERIRATVMGASQYSLQVSGNTIFLSENAVLPKRNLQVVKVRIEEETPTQQGVEASLRRALGRYDIDATSPPFPMALAIEVTPETIPGPDLLRCLTEGIVSAFRHSLAGMDSLVLILDIDLAHLMGNLLWEKLGPSREILCLDGIEVGDLDYIDIGAEIESSRTVPVVVKNLVFSKGSV